MRFRRIVMIQNRLQGLDTYKAQTTNSHICFHAIFYFPAIRAAGWVLCHPTAIFLRAGVKESGLKSIPVSTWFSNSTRPQTFVRLWTHFCKVSAASRYFYFKFYLQQKTKVCWEISVIFKLLNEY